MNRENLLRALKAMIERTEKINELRHDQLVDLLVTITKWETMADCTEGCNDIMYRLQTQRNRVESVVLNKLEK